MSISAPDLEFSVAHNSLILDGSVLPVMESFYTLQGEGAHQGRAAWFVRLGGCDVGCVWCDVKESWPADAHPQVGVEQIVAQALEHPGRLAVVTGGEPLLYRLENLTSALRQAGFKTHLETSGAHPLSGFWDWICLSPKKFKAPLTGILPQAHELKMVIYHISDFDWAEKYAQQTSPECVLYLQPEWSKAEQMLPLMIDYIKANPKWRMTLQTHKFLNID